MKLHFTKAHIRFFAALLGYVCLACLFLFPIFQSETFLEISHRQNEMFPWAAEKIQLATTLHHDQTWTYYPWQVFLNRSLRAGEIPLWNPDSFAGHPFLANGQSGIFYLPRTLLSLLVSPARVHDILLLTHLILGGFLMFLFLDGQRLSGWASFFGGLAWMFNSFTLAWLALDFFVVVVAWLPLLFYLAQLALTRQSWPASVGCGVVLGLFFLGGNLLFVQTGLLAWGAYAISLSLPRWWKGWQQPGAPWLICRDLALMSTPILLCAGLVAIQLIPNFELVSSIQRIPTSYSRLLATGRLQWHELTYFFTSPPLELSGWGQDPYHRALFLGTPTACLTLIGIWQRNALARFASGLALMALLVALGTPVFWFVYHLVPGFGHIKPLGRILFLFNFAASILAAFGLDALLRCRAIERLRPYWPNIDKFWPPLWQSSVHLLCALMLSAIVVTQLFHYSRSVMRHQPNVSARLYPPTPLIRHLEEDREHRFLASNLALSGSIPLVFPLHNVGGYESLLPERTNVFWRVVEGTPPRSAAENPQTKPYRTVFEAQFLRFDLLPRIGVTHFVTPPFVSNLAGEKIFNYGQRMPNEQWQPVAGDWNGDGKDTIGLYESRSGAFHLRNTNSAGADDLGFHFGEAGKDWLPVAGDWDGDGVDSIGLFDPKTNTFHLRNANSDGAADLSFVFAPPGKGFLPLIGDWNGDGKDTVGLYEPMTAAFYLRNQNQSGAADVAFFYGAAGQGFYPIAGDWNGDGIETIGIYHPQSGTFMLRDSNDAGFADYTMKTRLAGEQIIPLIGRWRDGNDALGIFDSEHSRFSIQDASPFDFFSAKLSYKGKDGKVYQLQNSLPQAYVTFGCEPAQTSLAALERFCDSNFDPSRAVVIEDEFLKGRSLRCSPPDQSGKALPVVAAQTIKRSLNTLTVRAVAPQEGWLVINEAWDKGWQATIDGQPTPVLPGNYLFRALRLPAGEHTVELRYQPRSFVIGRAISVATLLLLLALTAIWLRSYRRQRFATS